MTLKLELSPVLQERLDRAAKDRAISVEHLALKILDQSLPPTQRQANAVGLLQSWMESNAAEQQETGEHLISALDNDRPSNRKLFPPHLKGITW